MAPKQQQRKAKKAKPQQSRKQVRMAPLAMDRFPKVGGLSLTGNRDELVLDFEEICMICTVPSTSAPAQSITIRPGASGMARLDQFGQLYDQYRFEKMDIIYRSQVSANTNGFAVVAIDYNTNDIPQNFQATQGIIPRTCDKVWADMSLSVPVDRLMKSKWHFTAINTTPSGFGPVCNVNFHSTGANGAVVGSLWMRYRVRFSGPSTSSLALSTLSSGSGVLPMGTEVTAAVAGVMPASASTAPLTSIIPMTGSTINNAGVRNGTTTVFTWTPGTLNSTSWSPYDIVEATFDVLGNFAADPPPSGTVLTYTQNSSTSGGALYNPLGGEPGLTAIQSKSTLIATGVYSVLYTIKVVDYWINFYGNAALALTVAAAGVVASAATIAGRFRPGLLQVYGINAGSTTLLAPGVRRVRIVGAEPDALAPIHHPDIGRLSDVNRASLGEQA